MSITISAFTIIDGRRFARAEGRSFNVGPVGEDLAPWFDHVYDRYGVDLVLPDDLYEVVVFFVDKSQPQQDNGYYPKIEVAWTALGAPDCPTRAGFVADEDDAEEAAA